MYTIEGLEVPDGVTVVSTDELAQLVLAGRSRKDVFVALAAQQVAAAVGKTPDRIH
jgi:hypothetical protein